MQVKYAALPNFEEREEDFRAESVLLRRRFTDEGAGPPAPRPRTGCIYTGSGAIFPLDKCSGRGFR